MCTGQPEGQWDVPPVVEIGSWQGTLLDPHQIKAVNYGVTGYQELPGVSSLMHMRTIILFIDQ